MIDLNARRRVAWSAVERWQSVMARDFDHGKEFQLNRNLTARRNPSGSSRSRAVRARAEQGGGKQ